jgi:hypothetical protein
MSPRSRKVVIGGVTVQTPVLIPSTTSRGMPYSPAGVSSVNEMLELVDGHLGTAILFSAFDLYHGTLPITSGLFSDDSSPETLFPPLVVVDSGGYETQTEWESGFVPLAEPVPRRYGYEDYVEVTKRLRQRPGLLVVSYDGPDQPASPYDQQIKYAFDSEASNFALNLLLKPSTGRKHDWEELSPVAGDLQPAAVIGVTVPELGNTLTERLMSLWQLRELLDKAGITAPIHVFGCLDPLLTPLYFAFGGELFDGLSWLRYAYHEGMSVHIDQAALLEDQLDQDPKYLRAYRLLANLQYLEESQAKMRIHAAGLESDFEIFGKHSSAMRAVHEQVQTRIRQGGA